MCEAIDHGCNWDDDDDVLYLDLVTVVHREASSAVAIYFFRPQKSQFINGLVERTVVDIAQLGCPPPTEIRQPALSCTFPCHDKSEHNCALRTAYSLAKWLNFHIVSVQYAKCPPQPVVQ